MRCRIFFSLIWVYTVCSGLSVQILLVSTVVLWLVSVMSHHLKFTYSYCELTYILHSNKQSGYPAWPLHTPRLTHLTLSQLTVCGSMDRWHDWIQRVLWHRWLMSIVPISKVAENIIKVNRWTFILFHFPLKGHLKFITPYPLFLVVPLQSKHWPFGDKCDFSNNFVLYFSKNPSIATLQTKFSERGCI